MKEVALGIVRMRKVASLVMALLLLTPSFVRETKSAEQRRGAPVGFVGGVATITQRVARRDVNVEVKVSKTTAGPLRDGFRWAGEGAIAPNTLATSIVVRSDVDSIFVPLSAYADLGDPRRVSLNTTTTGFELTIAGGDAAVAYDAVLTFEDGRLVRRKVSHGEFPDEAWEETRYSYNDFDN